jgi:two-component system response regulator GlrR
MNVSDSVDKILAVGAMCRIAIVANNESFARCLGKALTENAPCKIFSLAETDHASIHNEFVPPDLLIIDLEAADQPARRFLAELDNRHPETTVIVIAPAENLPAAEALAPRGVDEILARPVGEEQKRRLIERILLRISALDRLWAVQEKLRREMRQSQIVAKSKPMREIIQRLPQLAACASTVLINGETGTGKELFARAIHYLGARASQPFITVDCGALPDHLVENELFGHARGAYTDANSSSKGLIQEANGGTLFLDEVEALPLTAQSKFLRFLQERQYKPLGQAKYVSANVRVVAAANIDLARAIEKKGFREDLYYRLNVVPLFIPPLRERKADIPALAHAFLRRHAHDQKMPARIPDEILRHWMDHDWPGNVRELENKVQQWLLGAPADGCRDVADSAPKSIRPFSEARKEMLAQFEQTYLQNLLANTKGNISAAARLAGTDRKHFRALLKKHGIEAQLSR